MNFSLFINHFIALLVITNPLSALPAVLRVTRNQSLAQKRRTGIVAAVTAGAILIVMTWIGTPLLLLLGIKLHAFQVAGGVVLFMMSLSMLSAEESPIKHTPEEQKEMNRDSGAIVPLAIPIIAGPGGISSIIVSVNQYPGWINQTVLTFSVILVAFVMGCLLYWASNIEKLCGTSGINIINRLGGLVLAAISIQTLASGITGLFPVLGMNP